MTMSIKSVTPNPARKGRKLIIRKTTLKDLSVQKDVKAGAMPVSMFTNCNMGQCSPRSQYC